MFGKKTHSPSIDKDQLALIEAAQRRIKQKRGLYVHFVIFLIGSVFLIVLNTVLGVGETLKIMNLDWFVTAILVWLFLLVYHIFNVFVTHKFMGKSWEEAQLNTLVALQQERIAQLKAQVAKEYPLNIQPTSTPAPLSIEEKKKTFSKALTLVVAADENSVIGKDNALIWHLSDDLKRFKQLTSGHTIIMGRKTFESFPKPLPNRQHIVITRQSNYVAAPGVLVVHSIEAAIAAVAPDAKAFVIGGGEIYKQALPYATRIELTRVHHEFVGDTYFPKLDLTQWQVVARDVHKADDRHLYDFTYLTYERQSH